jgi:hypothetical protein
LGIAQNEAILVILKLISGFLIIHILASKCPKCAGTLKKVCAKFVPNIRL